MPAESAGIVESRLEIGFRTDVLTTAVIQILAAGFGIERRKIIDAEFGIVIIDLVIERLVTTRRIEVGITGRAEQSAHA